MSKLGLNIFQPVFSTKEKSQMQTLVKGCRIIATFRSSMRTQSYVEMFLAYIETFVATLTMKDIAISCPEVKLDFKIKDSGKTEIKRTGRTTEYTVKINMKTSTDEVIWNLCAQFLGYFVTQNSMINDFESLFNQKEKEEKLGERLAILGGHYNEFSQCFLPDYRECIEKWCEKDIKTYPSKSDAIKTSTGNRGHQANQIITDLIDYPLWDKALWSGCGYMMVRDWSQPAILILLYKNFSYAKSIFEKWEQDYRDKKLNLKLTFITGVNKDNPKWYKVIISPDMEKVLENEEHKESRYVVAASRFHLMQSVDDSNMRMFKLYYERFHYAGITAAEIENNQISSVAEKRYPRIIPLANVSFREAWTIGENDPDSMAIMPNDTPIIPSDHTSDAPVIKLLELKTKKYGKNSQL